MSVVCGEVFDTEVSEAGSTDTVTLYFTFTTGGTRWSDDTFIQNYISIEDPDIAGNYMSATCNAKYKRDKAAATDITINNFLGSNPMTVAATGDFGKKWNAINVGDATDCCFVKDEVTSNPYASTYESRTSYQSCSATMTLYSTADGEARDSVRNVDYLKAIREGRQFNVLTGFRVWEDKSEKDTDASGDA